MLKKNDQTNFNTISDFLTFSCTDINQVENNIPKLENLRAENDSMRKNVADIETPYLFDSISFREHEWKRLQLRTELQKLMLKLLVVGYNPNRSYFVKCDSLVDGQ